ncbi:MAG: hypothetical protein QNJ97_11965 [Myxococcota bacterium]|nr:hypothetical protein [Myxococcota bacterium]
MRVIGIDENGLGPVLGPLIVTATAFDVDQYDPKAFWDHATAVIAADDSKKIFKKGHLALAEQATLSWLSAFDMTPHTHADAVRLICMEPPIPMPCPPGERPGHCHPSDQALPAFQKTSSNIASANVRPFLLEAGIRPVAVKAVSACPGAFNLATAPAKMNKFKLDFQLMTALAAALAKDTSEDVTVLCGKVGSTRRYRPWFSDFEFDPWWVETEMPEVSTYRVRQIGRVSFVRDGDASHLPIAMASMVGKYLRELAMRDLNRRLASSTVRFASGYRDPVTAGFIADTRETRDKIGLIDDCFLRRS